MGTKTIHLRNVVVSKSKLTLLQKSLPYHTPEYFNHISVETQNSLNKNKFCKLLPENENVNYLFHILINISNIAYCFLIFNCVCMLVVYFFYKL